LIRMGVEAGDLEHKRVEDLIATGLYRTRVRRMKMRIRELYVEYEPYLRPLDEVRAILGGEVPAEKSVSQEIVELRRREIS